MVGSKIQSGGKRRTISQAWLYGAMVAAILATATSGLFNRLVPQLHDINTFLWARAAYELMAEGIMYPQWLPQMWYGFGLPIFYFYPPLFYWLAGWGQLAGLTVIVAIKGVLILSTIIGGLFLYFWLREIVSKAAAALATGLWLLSPYYLSLIYVRGAFPEYMALNLIPILLWATWKMWQGKHRNWYWLAMTLTIAAIVLTHNLTTVLALAVGAAYVGYLYFGEQRNREGARYSLVALGAAGLITSFYWMPMLAYSQIINTSVLTIGAFYFGANFPELNNLINARLHQGTGWLTLGFLPIFVLLIGWISFPEILSPLLRRRLLFFLSAATFFVALVVPYFSFLWGWIPGLPIFQFPARLMGPAGLLLAITAALLLDAHISQHRNRALTASGVIVLAIALAWPFVQVRPYSDTFNLTAQDFSMQKYFEAAVKMSGQSPDDPRIHFDRGAVPAEYLPRQLTDDQSGAMLQGVLSKFMPPRPDSDSYDLERPPWIEASHADTQIQPVIERYLHHRFIIQNVTDEVIQINQFEFPTWRITLNDLLVKPEIIDDEAGQSLRLAAGTNVLDMKIVATPPVWWGRVVTLLGLLLMGWWMRKSPVLAQSGKLGGSKVKVQPHGKTRKKR